MVSAVGEGAEVALQATTIGPSPQAAAAAKVDKASEKSTEAVGGGGKAKGDTVTISPEAKQLTAAALKAVDESQESSGGKSKEESTGKK